MWMPTRSVDASMRSTENASSISVVSTSSMENAGALA